MVHTKESRGIQLLLFANVAFAAMACLIRYAAVENASVTALFRFTVGIVTMVILAFTGSIELRFKNRKGLLLRGLLGGIAIGLGFHGITHLGLIKASMLINTYPLFATLFGALLLKERPSPKTIGAIGIAFIGLLLILSKGESLLSLSFEWNGPTLLTLLGAGIGGLAVVQVKELSRSESSSAIYLSQCLAGAILMIIPAGIKQVSLSPRTMLLLLAMGLFASIGQLCITEGIKHVQIATSSLLAMLGPLVTILAGIFLFQEQVHTQMVLGITLTLGATLMTMNRK